MRQSSPAFEINMLRANLGFSIHNRLLHLEDVLRRKRYRRRLHGRVACRTQDRSPGAQVIWVNIELAGKHSVRTFAANPPFQWLPLQKCPLISSMVCGILA